jgi:betaine-aldehyde dehydrogenase/5-carboxymethyl-2-hydroxymuconic-semialdehyde dehydrogenase
MTERFDVAGVSVSGDHFIGGERVSSSETFETRSPLDWNLKLGDIARGDAATAAAAVAAAVEAFPAWAALAPAERGRHLHALADLIDARKDDIAAVECMDMAMLLESLELRVIPRGALNFRNYADIAAAHEERVWSSKGTANRVIRMPAGPAVIITPWNAPFMLSTWKCAPALAAGNTVILKPAEWSPLSASVLADLIAEAGIPPGVFNIVQGYGAEIGAGLVGDPRVRRISFTGSVPTARRIGAAAAGNIVPFTAELGGKSCLLVFADADIDAAAKKAAGQFDDSGQVCMAGTRLIVEESVRDEFLDRFHAYTDAHVLGDSREPETTISPMIYPAHLERVDGFVKRARANGDEIVRGGRIFKEDGLWYEPTLIFPKSNDSEVVQNEIFGPVLTFQTFSSEA